MLDFTWWHITASNIPTIGFVHFQHFFSPSKAQWAQQQRSTQCAGTHATVAAVTEGIRCFFPVLSCIYIYWRGMEIGSQVVKDSCWVGQGPWFLRKHCLQPPDFFWWKEATAREDRLELHARTCIHYSLHTALYSQLSDILCSERLNKHKWIPFVLSSVRSVLFKGMLATNHQAHGPCSWKFEFVFP